MSHQQRKKEGFIGDVMDYDYKKMCATKARDVFKEIQKEVPVVDDDEYHREEENINPNAIRREINAIDVDFQGLKQTMTEFNQRNQNTFFNRLMNKEFSVNYSRFDKFLSEEEKVGKWTSNKILMHFLFFINVERNDLLLGREAVTLFVNIFEKAEKKETEEDILRICFSISYSLCEKENSENDKVVAKDKIVTKEKIEKKLLMFMNRRNSFIGENNLKDPFVLFVQQFIRYIPETIYDANHLIELFKLAYAEIHKTGDDEVYYNPDVVLTFQEIDIDRNWKISKEEFVEFFMKKNAILQKNKALTEFFFDIVDLDGSGAIDIKEFAIFAKEYLSRSNIDTFFGLLKCAYHMIDLDNNGFIQHNEMKPILKRYFKTDKDEDYYTFIKQIDRNADDNITFWEFIRLFDVQYD